MAWRVEGTCVQNLDVVKMRCLRAKRKNKEQLRSKPTPETFTSHVKGITNIEPSGCLRPSYRLHWYARLHESGIGRIRATLVRAR